MFGLYPCTDIPEFCKDSQQADGLKLTNRDKQDKHRNCPSQRRKRAIFVYLEGKSG
jgi:hypothetical protein